MHCHGSKRGLGDDVRFGSEEDIVMAFARLIQIKASMLRLQTIPLASSFRIRKECWAICRGLSWRIFRLKTKAESLHEEILRAIELQKQKTLQEMIDTSTSTRNSGILLKSSDGALDSDIASPKSSVIATHLDGTGTGTDNASGIAKPKPCVIMTHKTDISAPGTAPITNDLYDTIMDYVDVWAS